MVILSFIIIDSSVAFAHAFRFFVKVKKIIFSASQEHSIMLLYFILCNYAVFQMDLFKELVIFSMSKSCTRLKYRLQLIYIKGFWCLWYPPCSVASPFLSPSVLIKYKILQSHIYPEPLFIYSFRSVSI